MVDAKREEEMERRRCINREREREKCVLRSGEQLKVKWDRRSE